METITKDTAEPLDILPRRQSRNFDVHSTSYFDFDFQRFFDVFSTPNKNRWSIDGESTSNVEVSTPRDLENNILTFFNAFYVKIARWVFAVHLKKKRHYIVIESDYLKNFSRITLNYKMRISPYKLDFTLRLDIINYYKDVYATHNNYCLRSFFSHDHTHHFHIILADHLFPIYNII